MEKKLDLLLVKPGNQKKLYGELSFSLSAIEPPLWAGLIASFIRERGYSVKIIDSEAEDWSPDYTAQKIIEYHPILTAIIVSGANPSASTMNMAGAQNILNALKEKNSSTKTLLGGLHPSALPERTLKEENVDFICQGEGFYTILQLLDTLKSGINNYKIDGLWYTHDNQIISNSRAPLVQNLDKLPMVSWDLLPMEKYKAHNWHCFGHLKRQPYAVIYTSLGCPFKCSFCCINAIFGRPGIRYRSPRKVIEEIDLLVNKYRMKNIKILDECFVLKKSHVTQLCDLIIEGGYDLNIWAYARVDTINSEMLKKMKQAGINWLAFGIESGSKKIRDGVDKGRFNQEEIYNAVKMTQSAGIYVVGNFIFGLPEDDPETMRQTLRMAKELNCEYTNFYAAMAYPGSQLYEDAVREGLQLPENWLGYAQFGKETLPLPTKYLSGSEVLRFRDNAFDEYYSQPKYLNMIREKFGEETLNHIKGMCKYKIHRNYA